jgi:hypothetical protein
VIARSPRRNWMWRMVPVAEGPPEAKSAFTSVLSELMV